MESCALNSDLTVGKVEFDCFLPLLVLKTWGEEES